MTLRVRVSHRVILWGEKAEERKEERPTQKEAIDRGRERKRGLGEERERVSVTEKKGGLLRKLIEGKGGEGAGEREGERDGHSL